MRQVDADKILADLPDDLPYKGSVKRVLMQAETIKDKINKIYIVFGDEARSDGDNILGVFNSWETAIKFATQEYEDYFFSIEEYEVVGGN